MPLDNPEKGFKAIATPAKESVAINFLLFMLLIVNTMQNWDKLRLRIGKNPIQFCIFPL
ncbi:hypothetical protein GCM10022289_19100 [Pedobacter jeongneungensis]|uniref:Uncharacterized protein n=1 Tax=Pedobacter jeongneungensis TaxID=947309 RepID=A0ABP8BBY8_9SPHI